MILGKTLSHYGFFKGYFVNTLMISTSAGKTMAMMLMPMHHLFDSSSLQNCSYLYLSNLFIIFAIQFTLNKLREKVIKL